MEAGNNIIDALPVLRHVPRLPDKVYAENYYQRADGIYKGLMDSVKDRLVSISNPFYNLTCAPSDKARNLKVLLVDSFKALKIKMLTIKSNTGWVPITVWFESDNKTGSWRILPCWF